MESTNIYATKSIPKLLLNACLPAVVVTMVVMLYNMADTFFVGQTGDPIQVAAITLSGPLFSILSGLGTLLGSGGCAAIAMALGRKEEGQVKALSSFCCYAALAIGLLFAAGVTIGMEGILSLLGATPETQGPARAYLQIIALGGPFILFSNVLPNVIRSEGAIKQAMISNAIGTALNIILDPIMILALDMGIAGAALATVISNAASMLYLIVYVSGKKSRLSIHPRHFSLKKAVSWRVISLGLPTALGILTAALSGIVTNTIIGQYGDLALAASGVAGKMGMIIGMVQMGVCFGLQPVIAYNHGAKDIRQIDRVVKSAAVLLIATGTALAAAGWFLRGAFLSSFLSDPQVLAFGERFILAGILTGPIAGLGTLCTNVMQGMDRAGWAAGYSLLRQGVLSIPVLLMMSSLLGITGIVLSSILVEILAATAGVALMAWQLRKAKRTMEIEAAAFPALQPKALPDA